MQLLTAFALTLLLAVVALRAWRRADERALDSAWQELRGAGGGGPGMFDPSLVDDLPPPARRFFLHAIEAGTPLAAVAEITMHGEMGLGTKDRPNYMPMRARQLLAPPQGFIWRVEAGSGAMRFSGSDGIDGAASWSRFWLLGTLPVARAGGNRDHRRAAFGRLIAEALFWTPAALLPRDGVSWSGIDDETARVTVEHDGLTQAVDVTVDGDGRPLRVVFERWTDANPEKEFRLQPFGGELFDVRDFGGYRLPTRVEAGNLFGTEGYFPFFRAVVDDVRFVGTG